MVGGKYVIRKVLGEGGMAVVYAAVDKTCDRQVAIKILRPGVATRRAMSADDVQREAATVVKLHERTPHVVEVLTAGVTDDRARLPYYVMERLWGATLRGGIEGKRTRGQPFEIIEVASTVMEIATPLAYAHEMGIVHRDVKPENVFMAEQRDSSYILKLLDFGVSALVGGDEAGTGRRAFTGSRPYAAPEQLDGQPPSPAGDVYALGLILYEMLTFTLPHDRLNHTLSVAETALNVLRYPIEPLDHFRSDVTRPMQNLVSRCLAKEPSQRPPALNVATMLSNIKRSFEAKLLGGDETNATDVTGPPIAVLAMRLEAAAAEVPPPFVAQRVVGTDPVDLAASTDPGATPSADHERPLDEEVFFMGPVEATTLRDAAIAPAVLPPVGPRTGPSIVPQPVLLVSQGPAVTAVPDPPAAPTVVHPAAVPVALPVEPPLATRPRPADTLRIQRPTPVVLPAQAPSQEIERSRQSLDAASHTVPEPITPRVRLSVRTFGMLAVSASVLVLGIAVTAQRSLRHASSGAAVASSLTAVEPLPAITASAPPVAVASARPGTAPPVASASAPASAPTPSSAAPAIPQRVPSVAPRPVGTAEFKPSFE